MERHTNQTRDTSHIWIAASGLLLYCLAVALITGDIGFEGDDWWIFSWAYWNTYPSSLLVYARESLRPVEGVFWITLFELFGFNKTVFHLFSLLLLAAASLVMGVSLHRAFPGNRILAVASILFAFFIPTVSCLTFVTTTDNSRLSLLLFWCSVLAYQRWARGSGTWIGLIVPGLLYLLSFLSYEAASMLLFAVPLLVLPIHLREAQGIPDRRILVRLATGIVVPFAAAVALRVTLLGGGAVDSRYVLPPMELAWGYLALLPFYLAAPFTEMSGWLGAWMLGFGVMVWAGLSLFMSTGRGAGDDTQQRSWCEQSRIYPLIIGVAIMFLGMLPYQIAGYGSVTPKLMDSVLLKWGVLPDGNSAWFNFNWSSRIYSSATFGLAIVLGSLIGGWRTKRLQWVANVAAAAIMGLYATFHAGLVPEWQEASQIRAGLCRDLKRRVPGVQPGTNFVFLNLDSTYKRAVVFRGWMGLRALLPMLYDEPWLGAYYVYPYAWKPPNHVFQQAFVSPKGFVSRGLRMDQPVPHTSLLIFVKDREHVRLLPEISASDEVAPNGIQWTGISSMRSNVSRILREPRPITDPRRSGLNKALQKAICGGDCLRGDNVLFGN